MSSIPVNLAVEDELSDVVLRRLLEHSGRPYAIGTTFGLRGFGYLRSTISGWNQAAAGRPFIVLTDLDQYPCVPALINEWMAGSQHPNLILRVAVREVEAWLLADRVHLGTFLNVADRHFPTEPDAVMDAKALLIALARRSRSKDVKARIVPRVGSTAKQGREYNPALAHFARTIWDVDASLRVSPSLARSFRRLQTFTPIW